VVYGATQLVVLLPEIGLNQFDRRCKPQNGNIASCQWPIIPVEVFLCSEKRSCG
jgi:hypothetical protein